MKLCKDYKQLYYQQFYRVNAYQRGVRTVEDGSAEFALNEDFAKYREKYEFSDPITSNALEYIGNGYQSEVQMDKTRAYLGDG